MNLCIDDIREDEKALLERTLLAYRTVSTALIGNHFFASKKSTLLSIGNLTYSFFPVIRNDVFSGNYCISTYHPKQRRFNKNPNIFLDMWVISQIAAIQGFYALKHADRDTGEVMLYLNKKEVSNGEK